MKHLIAILILSALTGCASTLARMEEIRQEKLQARASQVTTTCHRSGWGNSRIVCVSN